MALLRRKRVLAVLTCAATLSAVPAVQAAECGCWRYVRPEGRTPDATLTEITTPTPKSGWAVGQKGGHPLALTWNGARWLETPLPFPAGTTMEGVSAASPTDAWAIGAARDTAHLARWTKDRWAHSTFEGTPRAVEARTPTDAWIAGSTGSGTERRAALWRWNGTRWDESPTGIQAPSELTAVSAHAADNAWAVGHTGTRPTQPLLLRWDGRAWRKTDAPSPRESTVLADVVATGPNEAWAVGTTSPGGTPPTPVAQRWNGRAWTGVPIPGLDGRLDSVAPDGRGGVWASGEDATARPFLAHWTGRAWDVSRPPVPDPSGDDPGDGPASITALSLIPGTTTLRAAGSYGRPGDPLRHAITWANGPRPR